MRILMVHPHDIYHDLEPWAVRITYLAQELGEAGHEVRLVYHVREPHIDMETAAKRQDFSFETLPFRRLGPGLGKRCFEIEKHAGWADVVHFQKCTHYSSIPAVFGAFCHNRPVHYDWDDWEQKIYEQNNHNRLGSWIFFHQMERHLLKLVDTISVASEGIRQLTIRSGFPQARVFYAPVGADLELFAPTVDGSIIRRRHGWRKKIALYHGQISGANYVHLFIRAAKIIMSTRSDILFVIVGGGDRLHEAKKLAHELRLNDHLIFTGEVPHRDIPLYIAAADVTVACFEDNEQSRCKSPLKVVEYMASGKAIVASRMGEVQKMIGDCGILVDPEDPNHIAQGVNTLIDTPQLREKLGNLARTRAETIYSWKQSAHALIEAYQTALLTRNGLV